MQRLRKRNQQLEEENNLLRLKVDILLDMVSLCPPDCGSDARTTKGRCSCCTPLFLLCPAKQDNCHGKVTVGAESDLLCEKRGRFPPQQSLALVNTVAGLEGSPCKCYVPSFPFCM